MQVKPDSSVAQRSAASGKLVLVMPKENPHQTVVDVAYLRCGVAKCVCVLTGCVLNDYTRGEGDTSAESGTDRGAWVSGPVRLTAGVSYMHNYTFATLGSNLAKGKEPTHLLGCCWPCAARPVAQARWVKIDAVRLFWHAAGPVVTKQPARRRSSSPQQHLELPRS